MTSAYPANLGMIVIDARVFSSKHVMIGKHETSNYPIMVSIIWHIERIPLYDSVACEMARCHPENCVTTSGEKGYGESPFLGEVVSKNGGRKEVNPGSSRFCKLFDLHLHVRDLRHFCNANGWGE